MCHSNQASQLPLPSTFSPRVPAATYRRCAAPAVLLWSSRCRNTLPKNKTSKKKVIKCCTKLTSGRIRAKGGGRCVLAKCLVRAPAARSKRPSAMTMILARVRKRLLTIAIHLGMRWEEQNGTESAPMFLLAKTKELSLNAIS